MRRPGRRPRAGGQSGFSMIEMLMAAFILAIGILGLTMLQVMSLRAARGSRSLTAAVQVADRVMDQIEMEGRLTWLNITDTQYTAPTALTGLTYMGAGPFTNYFTIKGQAPDPAAALPEDQNPFFTVTTTRSVLAAAGTTGQMHDYTVVVSFVDTVDATNTAVTRSVTLTRRIVHG